MEKGVYKESLDQVKKKTFREAIYLAYKNGITSIAPLGFSGEDITIHGTSFRGRKSLIQVRNYSGSPELLITDMEGKFLFYGRFDIDLGLEFIVDHFWSIFKSVKPLINKSLERRSDFRNVPVNANATYTEGFDMLKAFQNRLF